MIGSSSRLKLQPKYEDKTLKASVEIHVLVSANIYIRGIPAVEKEHSI